MPLSTYIVCNPAKNLQDAVRKMITLFAEHKWFVPQKYGKLSLEKELSNPLTEEDWQDMAAFLKSNPSMIVYGKGKKYLDFFRYREGESKLSSNIWHYVSAGNEKDFQSEEYNDAIVEIMKLTGAFYAECQDARARERYSFRMERRDGFSEEVPTVRNIGEGLANPAWKMWLGERYINAIGREVLLSAPCKSVKDYGSIIYLNVFDDPAKWNTDEVLEQVHAFKQHIGYDYFYDTQDIGKKLKVPDFSDL